MSVRWTLLPLLSLFLLAMCIPCRPAGQPTIEEVYVKPAPPCSVGQELQFHVILTVNEPVDFEAEAEVVNASDGSVLKRYVDSGRLDPPGIDNRSVESPSITKSGIYLFNYRYTFKGGAAPIKGSLRFMVEGASEDGAFVEEPPPSIGPLNQNVVGGWPTATPRSVWRLRESVNPMKLPVVWKGVERHFGTNSMTADYPRIRRTSTYTWNALPSELRKGESFTMTIEARLSPESFDRDFEAPFVIPGPYVSPHREQSGMEGEVKSSGTTSLGCLDSSGAPSFKASSKASCSVLFDPVSEREMSLCMYIDVPTKYGNRAIPAVAYTYEPVPSGQRTSQGALYKASSSGDRFAHYPVRNMRALPSPGRGGVPSAAPETRCPQCGAVIGQRDQFCSGCGSPPTGAAPQEQGLGAIAGDWDVTDIHTDGCGQRYSYVVTFSGTPSKLKAFFDCYGPHSFEGSLAGNVSTLTFMWPGGTGSGTVTFSGSTLKGMFSDSNNHATTWTGTRKQSFVGVWDTSFGERLAINVNAGVAVGCYNGSGWAGIINGTVTGNVLNGRWRNTQGNQRFGNFSFTLADDGRSFTGRFTCLLKGQEADWRPWNGTLKGPLEPGDGNLR